MELDLFFVQEKVLNKLLRVVYVPAISQYADILTKALSPSNFETFRAKLTMCDPSILLGLTHHELVGEVGGLLEFLTPLSKMYWFFT